MTDAVQGPWGPRSVASAVAAAESAARRHVPVLPGSQRPGADDTTRLAFAGRAGELFGLLFRGFFLQLVTLGIYRFWLTTDIRRFYWSRTAIGTEALAYTGTGMQLLKGFLFALAILVPLQAGGFFLALGLPEAQWVVSIGLTLILLFLGQYAIFASRRYRLARTSWRGLRLRMTGSAWTYALQGFGLSFLVILTLGIAYPWATAALERTKMRATWYGDVQGDFAASPMVLARRLAPIWLVGLGLPLVIIGSAAAAVPWEDWSRLLGDTLWQNQVRPPRESTALAALVSAVVLSIFIPVALVPAFQAVTFRWRMSGIRLGGAGLASDFRIATAYRVYILALLALSGLGLVAFPLAGLMIGGTFIAFIAGSGGAAAGALVIAGVVLGYLLVIGGFWIAKQLLIGLPLYRAEVASLTVTGLATLDDVHVRNVDASALGEGLGSAVDFGIGL